MSLDSPLSDIKGVGEEVGRKFAGLGVKTAGDLMEFYPRRYEDYSVVTAIAKLRPGLVSISAVIKQATGRYARRGLHITEAVASDDSGSVRLVWFNQPYRERVLKAGAWYYLSGEYQLSYQRLSIMNPSVELVSEFPINTARIVPVYRETKGLASPQIRKVVRQLIPLIEALPETLPAWLIEQNNLMPRAEAVKNMHFPASTEALEQARRRLGFEEVFALSLASLLGKQENQKEASLKIPFSQKLAKDFVGHLPFKLTDAQRKVVWQIYQDMQKPTPMNRLVEGDVGSGKTVVATMAALMAMEQGFQAAFMAPTELLARQHANTIYNLLEPLGFADQVTLLVGSLKPADKKRAHGAIATGQARLIIGTHALISEKVDMHKLALIIIDEQHRFGVAQRKKLMAKAGHMPHVLSLTATPIPRSLALTLYGELDISRLTALPAGRQPVTTELVSPNSVAQLYQKIDQQLAAGHQMFVVCPLISESDIVPAKSAEKVYEDLSKGPFKHRRIGLLHGQLKTDEKNGVMQQFVNGQLDILVSTTVVEVGVDVSNASVMLIESPERFGLAQIHQLRGRVGRGRHASFCYLLLSDSKAPGRRLRALSSLNDGFKLAELDLTLRGPGAIYGQAQHGQLDLRVANLTDAKLVTAARAGAQDFIDRRDNLLQYNRLHQHVTKLRTVTNLN